MEKQFCHSTHIAHNHNVVTGQKPMNIEQRNDPELELFLLLVVGVDVAWELAWLDRLSKTVRITEQATGKDS